MTKMEKNLKKIILFLIVLIMGLLIVKLNIKNSYLESEIENQVVIVKIDDLSNKLKIDLEKSILNREEVSYSSSPYTIVKNNKNYNNLLSLGISGVVPLFYKIKEGSDNSLLKYIYAMAIEDIMMQKFSYNKIVKGINFDYGWANYKEFEESFLKFSQMVPLEYSKIINNGDLKFEEKKEKIIELGLFTVPYLIEDIESNKNVNECQNLLTELLVTKRQIVNEKTDINNWIKINKNNYNYIKKINSSVI